MAKDKREYGLSSKDRDWVICKKYAAQNIVKVKKILAGVNKPSDKILGAILFLARPENIDDLQLCVQLANESEEKLLNSATVKDERT